MAEQYPELWIIKPKEATNLITNPSFETNTTGWTKVGAGDAIAQSAAYQRRGVYSLEVTPATGAIAGAYFGTFSLSNGTTYTASVDVLDVAGQTFNLYIQAADGTPTATATSWTGTGHWARHSQTWACTSTETYRLYITRSSVASTTKFYIDGAQVESGAESTYFDGDYNGFNPLRQDYYWNGTPHGSTSYRSPRTRTGGTLLRVRDYAKILGIAGMGMAPVENYALPVGKSGSQYQGTRVNDRELTVYLRFYGATTDVMRDNRAQIVDAVKMDNVPDDEPVIMRYRLDTGAGAQVSEVLDMHLLYSGGLEDDTSEPGSQIVSKAAVQFTAYTPGLMLDGEAGAALGMVGTITQSQYMVYRSALGQWSSLGSINGPVYALARTPSGSVIAGGAFTVFGGAAGTGVVSLVGTTKTQVGAGVGGTVYALGVNAAGYIWAGGNHTTYDLQCYGYGGAANWGYQFPDTVTGTVSGTVRAIEVADDGNVYFAGNIGTSIIPSSWNIGYVNTAGSLTPLSTGLGSAPDTVWALEYANNNLFAALTYSTGGTTSLNSWKSGGTAWVEQISMITAENSIRSLKYGPDGRLYIGAHSYISSGGTSIGVLFSGTSTKTTEGTIGDTDAYIHDISFDKLGNQYIVGKFAYDFSQNEIGDYAMMRRAGAWWGLDIDTGCTTAQAIRALLVTPTNEIYMAGDWTSGTATTASVTAVNCASARAYPRVFFTGPGKLVQLVNYSTGRGIYFNGLTLQAGERAIFDFRPGRFKFESNWRGNLMKYIAAGSDLDMILLAGNNTISCYMTSTTAASAITMAWLPVYVSLDGAMW